MEGDLRVLALASDSGSSVFIGKFEFNRTGRNM